MLLIEVLRALLEVAVPVGTVSYLLFWWALKHDYFGPVSSIKEMRRRTREHARASKDQRKDAKRQKKRRRNGDIDSSPREAARAPVNPLNPVHNKWLKFGGGFYGVVALMTYAVNEWTDVGNFLARFDGFATLRALFSIDFLVNLLVNSISNFLVAITWPAYWLDTLHVKQPWIWFLAAYFGYWLGCRVALRRQKPGPENDLGSE